MVAGLRFSVLAGPFAIARLAPDAHVPAWAMSGGGLSSITRTREELSIVCDEAGVPEGVRAEGGWAALVLQGPFPFEQVGVLASVAGPLAAAGISLFAVSTFDTDHVLVKVASVEEACRALERAGHVRA